MMQNSTMHGSHCCSGQGGGLAQLQLDGGCSIQARLVVGADGANSRLVGARGFRIHHRFIIGEPGAPYGGL